MEKLFLLDAYALIYRAYYAFIRNPRINSKGFNTSAIFGFVNTLEEVLKNERPTHIAVAFDPAGPTFRHEAYADYKAQREATPEAIRLSVPIIKDIIRAYRIPLIEVPGYEADDVIGTLATQAGQMGIHTYMMTPDKDYAQLVTDHVFMYRPSSTEKRFEVLGVEEVKAKYGLQSPRQVIDLLGLMGDASDNIPGCPGVGEKTAQKLIGEFGSIDQLLANTDKLKGAIRTKVENNREAIEFSRFLATIKTDVPLTIDWKQLRRVEPDHDALSRLLQEMEIRKPASILGLFADEGTSDEKESNLASLKTVAHAYKTVDTEEERDKLLQILLTNESFSLAWTGPSGQSDGHSTAGLAFGLPNHQAYFVPLPTVSAEAGAIVRQFRPAFESDSILKIGHDLKRCYLALLHYGIELQGPLFDTLLAHYVLQPELPHTLHHLAPTYLAYETLAGGSPDAQASDLACEEADVAMQLRAPLEQALHEQEAEALFHEVEMPLIPVLAHMEHNGVRVDTESLKQTSALLNERMQALEKEIHQLAGMAFNISSPRQVGDVLFGHLQLSDKVRKTKSGQYSTSEEVLESLRGKHPIVGLILDYRGLKKLLSGYVDALPQLVNPETGKIHTSFNQAVTSTGRLSSSNPNLQNIPIRDADGREIRKAFLPDEGCLFFSADYSQIELRIMAHLSGDANLTEAFRSGADIHTATAAQVFHTDLDQVTREQRSRAKTANFGIIYGISAFGLAERMGVDRREAKALIDGYFATYPSVKQYMDHSIERARENGYVETLFHRRRYLPDINSRNAVVRGYAERNAINAPIQGSAADLIKVAMARIFARFRLEGLQAKMLIQVHDELNFSVPPCEREQVERIVVEEMERACPLNVPLKADCGWGQNWLEAH